LDLIEVIRRGISTGEVEFVERREDPRDYKVSFDKIRAKLGYETLMTVPDGVDELHAALDDGLFADPFEQRYRNS
jgi:hypothetical protein